MVAPALALAAVSLPFSHQRTLVPSLYLPAWGCHQQEPNTASSCHKPPAAKLLRKQGMGASEELPTERGGACLPKG